MSTLKKVFREPLVHFLIMGLALFAAFELFSTDDYPGKTRRVIVDRDRLLTFIQQRTRIFESNRFEDMLDGLSKKELEVLVKDYVRDEVLYREAKALKLDENDFTARQRLIQQLNFINQGVLFSALKLSDQELNQYLEQNKARYRVRPKVTFTHVYFSREKHGNEGARSLAEAKLDELQKGEVPFHEALGHGDRFLYHRNYVNKEADEIQSHFGEVMKKSLFEKIGKGRGWFGPLRSDYGFHLVLVTQHRPGHEPDLDEVRARVEHDALRARVDEELAKVTQTIIDEYEVEVAGELQKELAPSLD